MRDGKTALQRMLELQFKHPIEVLLQGPLSDVAEKLKINKTTVQEWRQHLGIRPPGWCGKHDHRIDDFCGDCWLEHLAEPQEVELSQE